MDPDCSRARYAAESLIKSYGIDEPAEIDVAAISFDRGIMVREHAIDGAEGWLLRREHRGVVRVRSDTAELGRKRFTVAHELGHWELHSQSVGRTVCSPASVHGYKGDAAEIEASAFASELLMPTYLFRPQSRTRDVSLVAIRSLAEAFNTTLTATAVRYVEESRDPCIVIFSSDGRVNWVRRSQPGGGLWVAPRTEIPDDSFASDPPDVGEGANGMQEVEYSVWFPEGKPRHSGQLWEESIRLGEYDVVMTLLCLVE